MGTSLYKDFTRLHRRLIAPLNTVVVENTRDLVLSKQATGRTKSKLKWLWQMDFLEDIFDTMSEMKCLDVDVQMNLSVDFQKRLDTFDKNTMKTEKNLFIFLVGPK